MASTTVPNCVLRLQVRVPDTVWEQGCLCERFWFGQRDDHHQRRRTSNKHFWRECSAFRCRERGAWRFGTLPMQLADGGSERATGICVSCSRRRQSARNVAGFMNVPEVAETSARWLLKHRSSVDTRHPREPQDWITAHHTHPCELWVFPGGRGAGWIR